MKQITVLDTDSIRLRTLNQINALPGVNVYLNDAEAAALRNERADMLVGEVQKLAARQMTEDELELAVRAAIGQIGSPEFDAINVRALATELALREP